MLNEILLDLCIDYLILTRGVPLMEQELPTLPEHLCSPPVFSGVRVTRSLVLYVCFVYRCLSFCTFSFGHCVVCSSSIYGFWLLFIFNTDTWWERKMLRGLIYSRRNRDVNKRRRLLYFFRIYVTLSIL